MPRNVQERVRPVDTRLRRDGENRTAECEIVIAPPGEPEVQAATPPTPTGRRWADLMRRAFDVDVLACPRCGGRLQLLARLETGSVRARILWHVGLPAEVPPPRPARARPLPSGDESW